jgi:hypothetical protein
MQKISVWITSTGRFEFLKITLDSFIQYNTYPNIEFLIFESIPTEDSRKYFNTSLIETDKCIKYLKELDIPNKHLWIESWPPWGDILQKFLNFTDAKYCISLEDDCQCVYDPKEQWLDEIEVIKDDPYLLGFRNDLSNPGVDENDKRFVGVKQHPVSDYLYWPVAGGAPMWGVEKLKKMGGFLTNHSLRDFWRVESDMNTKMTQNNMYIGVMLKYFGSFAHIGHTEVTGRDRKWSSSLYLDMAAHGYFGPRKKGL